MDVASPREENPPSPASMLSLEVESSALVSPIIAEEGPFDEVASLASPTITKDGPLQDVAATPRGESSSHRRCGCWGEMWDYGGIPEARGYALLAMGRGVAVMSNIVVNAALLELASEAAGCPTGKELKAIEEETGETYECTNTIYGQNPLSLISNIAVVTGLMSALFMPVIGAILDFTSYRRFVGVLFAVVFSLIQATQITIGRRTWFAMAILQSIAGFCFSGMIMTTLAYLPEIGEKAGRQRHTDYTARFTSKQFMLQASFLVLIGALSFVAGIADDSVQTARMSQALNVSLIVVLFGVGWYAYMPSRPASRELPQGKRCLGIVIHGIRQNLRTAKSIFHEYKKGLRWFLFAEVFAQSSVGALTTVSVVYLSGEVGLTATDITLFFLVVLVGTIPGAKIAPAISKRTNPNTSWQLSMVCLFITMVIGAFTLGDAPNKYLSLFWGFFVGAMLGWFYPTENLFFSCVLPRGQEAEISGFRVISSMILSWLPPLIFSLLVSNGVDAKFGMTLMASFVLIAAAALKFGAGTWEEILQESERGGLDDANEVCADPSL